MVVSIVLDSEYMGMEARIKWFMKNLSHALENDYLIITHECLKNHYEELVQKCSERFYTEFEMRHISKEELEKIDIYYIPDSFFENLYRKSGTRTKMIVDLSTKRDYQLEGYIQDAIENALQKRQDAKVDYIMNCLHCFKSISVIGEYYNCPIIPYVFSAIRKVHGYQQTLYMANLSVDLMNNSEIENLYRDFDTDKLGIDLLSNEEILCLLGKERNLPLLPFIDEPGIYEMGVAKEGYQITPQSYCVNYATDDDIYYESKKYYMPNQIISRLHPMQMDQFGFGRKEMRNDPVSFILSCKRVATIQSQMIVKAMLWNRVPCVLSDALPYAFLYTNDFTEIKKINKKELNFIIFCYFIPDSCMFSAEYWRWRKQFPSPNEIMSRHLSEIVKNLGYEKDILSSGENRLIKILNARGCDWYLIDDIVNKYIPNHYNYQFISSRLRIYYTDGNWKDVFCVNDVEDTMVVSKFRYSNVDKIDCCVFFPLDDIAGKVKIDKINLANGKLSYQLKKKYKYYNKGESDIKADVELCQGVDLDITFYWRVKDESK